MNYELRYVPYESIARAESDETMANVRGISCLGGLSVEQITAMKELVADAFVKGLDMGFLLSETEPHSPATLMEVYNAGVTEGIRIISETSANKLGDLDE